MKRISITIVMMALFASVMIMPMNMSTLEKTSPVQQDVDNKKVWVKVWFSSDRTKGVVIVQVPRWQIDQMETLQIMLQDQHGTNSQNNPIRASMLTMYQLKVMQNALDVASDLNDFHLFCNNLTRKESKTLIKTAFALEAQGLLALIMNSKFSVEVQEKLNIGINIRVPGIMTSVINYLIAVDTFGTSHADKILSLACSPDNNFIVSSGSGPKGKLLLHDMVHTQEMQMFNGNIFPKCQTILYSSDGRYIAAGSMRLEDNLIICDGKTGQQIHTIKGPKARNGDAHSIAFSPDSTRFLAFSQFQDNFYLIVYDVTTGQKIYEIIPPDDITMYNILVLWNAQNDIIITYQPPTGIKEHVCIYDGATYALKKRYTFDRVQLLVSPDCRYMVDKKLNQIVNVATNEVVHQLPQLGTTMCWSSDSKYLVATNEQNNSLLLVDVITGKTVELLKGYNGNIQTVIFSPDGKYIVWANGAEIGILKRITDSEALKFMEYELNIAQAHLLYRLYLAKINHKPATIDSNSFEYQLYQELPDGVQRIIKDFLLD